MRSSPSSLILLFALVTYSLVSAASANAQQASLAAPKHALTGVAAHGFAVSGQAAGIQSAPKGPSFFTPLSQDVALSYFRSDLPIHDWGGGFVYSPYLIFAFGERMTLPSQIGYVDSIAVTLDSISSDSIAVLLFPDTLYDAGAAGMLHLMNIFDAGIQPYGVAFLHDTAIHGRTRIVVPFDHVPVPKEFFVTIEAQAGHNIFELVGDSEAARPLTTDGARSGWIGENQSAQFVTYILDGQITPVGDADPLYSNLDITAYVAPAGSSGVIVENSTMPSTIGLSPNPASIASEVTLSSAGTRSALSVFDLLGRKVLQQQVAPGSRTASLDLSRLPNGAYRVVTEQGAGTTLIVAH